MLAAIQKYFTSVSPVFMDGALYINIALFQALTAAFSSDEAAKYIEPESLFWVRTFCGVNSAWLLALKMFRSTAFAEHQAKQAEEKEQNKNGI